LESPPQEKGNFFFLRHSVVPKTKDWDGGVVWKAADLNNLDYVERRILASRGTQWESGT